MAFKVNNTLGSIFPKAEYFEGNHFESPTKNDFFLKLAAEKKGIIFGGHLETFSPFYFVTALKFGKFRKQIMKSRILPFYKRTKQYSNSWPVMNNYVYPNLIIKKLISPYGLQGKL